MFSTGFDGLSGRGDPGAAPAAANDADALFCKCLEQMELAVLLRLLLMLLLLSDLIVLSTELHLFEEQVDDGFF